MKRFVFSLLAAFLAGILVSRFFAFPVIPLWILVALFLVLLPRRRSVGSGWFLVVFAGLGALSYSLDTAFLPENHLFFRVEPGRSSILTGTISSLPEVHRKRVCFLLDAERYNGVPVCGKVRLTVYLPQEAEETDRFPLRLEYGERVEARTVLRIPRNYENPGGFDYVSYLARKGIRVTGTVPSEGIRVLKRGEGNPWIGRIYKNRRRFEIFMAGHLSPIRNLLLAAVLLGNREEIPDRLRERFVIAGAGHLLAISGLHIGFAALSAYFLFLTFFRFLLPIRLLRASRICFDPSRIASVCTLFFVVFYTLLVGARTSSVRAAIMIITYLVARIIERNRDVFHTLVLAAFFILVWRPASLFEVDFQLSFTAVSAIVLSGRRKGKPALKTPVRSVRPSFYGLLRKVYGKLTGGGFGQLFRMSLLAVSATAPILASSFHRIALAGLVSNLCLVPLTGIFIVPLGLVAYLLFNLSPPLAILPLKLAGVGAHFLLSGVDFFSKWTWTAPWVFPPPPLLVFLYYLMFGLLLYRFRRSGLTVCILLLLFFFLAIDDVSGRVRGDGLLHIVFPDVGEGASILMVLPDAETVLIDGGGTPGSSFDLGRRVLLPTLLARGIRKIDLMILTHPHPDHLKGLISILEEIPVSSVWDGWDRYPSESYRRFRKVISARNIPRRFLGKVDEKLLFKGLSFQVMNIPSGKELVSEPKVNDSSLVLKVTLGQVSLLVTGDLETAGEQRLLRREGDFLKCTILQVAHHGSLSSSSCMFLDRVRPELAVISVGSSNRFGHPSPTVLGRLRYIHPEKRVYRTDRNGMIEIVTDGVRVSIRTCR